LHRRIPAGWIKARSISPSWSPLFAALQWSNLTTRGFLRRSSEPHSEITLNIFEKIMKPTPQISSNQRSSHRDHRAPHGHQSLPLTDHNFHATAETQTSSCATLTATESPAFYKLSAEFFGAETNRDYLAELILFTLITGVSAWPIISMIVALTRLVRNY